MRLLLERLPDVTLVSVGHRPELEQFHGRKLVLEYHRDGARLASDESLEPWTFPRPARVLTRMFGRERAPGGRRSPPPTGEPLPALWGSFRRVSTGEDPPAG
jgi:putative ATP-binding cassette transporter